MLAQVQRLLEMVDRRRPLRPDRADRPEQVETVRRPAVRCADREVAGVLTQLRRLLQVALAQRDPAQALDRIDVTTLCRQVAPNLEGALEMDSGRAEVTGELILNSEIRMRQGLVVSV